MTAAGLRLVPALLLAAAGTQATGEWPRSLRVAAFCVAATGGLWLLGRSRRHPPAGPLLPPDQPFPPRQPPPPARGRPAPSPGHSRVIQMPGRTPGGRIRRRTEPDHNP